MARLRLLTAPRPPSPSHSSSSSSSRAFPSLSRFALAVTALSAIVFLGINHAYSAAQPAYPPGSLPPDARGGGAGSCRMSFMSPSYMHLSGFGREFTRLGNGPWGLYLYREAGWDEDPLPDDGKHDKLVLHGTPVLFVPGNAGSFRQVRSLAAAASRTWFEVPGVPRRSVAGSGKGAAPLDFFTLDFNDDFSAFHGQTLLDQAEYTADCVRYILSLYAHHEDETHGARRPDPTSAIVVAHSMGGIVARAAVLNKGYQSGSISTLITFATPHQVPPVTVDAGVDRVYEAINSYWREAYSLSALPSSAPSAAASSALVSSPYRLPPSTELASLVLISLSGGLSDLTIASESVSLSNLVPSSGSHGFTAFTTAIPGVQTPIDHLAILWCQQLIYTVAEGLLAIADTTKPEGVISREERVRELGRRWLGAADAPGAAQNDEGERARRVPLSQLKRDAPEVALLGVGERLVVRPAPSSASSSSSSRTPGKKGARTVHVVPIPPSRTYAGQRVFSLLTDGRVGRKNGEAVEVWACEGARAAGMKSLAGGEEDDEDSATASKEKEKGKDDPECLPLFPSHLTRLPSSPHSTVSPILPAQITTDGAGLALVEVEAEDKALKGMKAVVVVVKRDDGERDEEGPWVVAEWAEKDRRTRVVDKGAFELLFLPYKTSIPFLPSSSAAKDASTTSSAALVSELWVPALDTSLLTLRARVWRGACHDSTSLFAPLLRQSSPIVHETKTFPIVRLASLYTHAHGPYLPSPAAYAPHSAHSGQGARLQLFLDPTCPAGEDGAVEVEIGVNWMATLGSLVVRYRMAMVTVPFAVVMLVLAKQLRDYDAGSPFPSFGLSLSALLRRLLPLTLLTLTLLAYAQSALLASHASTHAAHPHTHAADALPPAWIADALLGTSGAVWAPMGAVVVFAMVVVVVVEYWAIAALVGLLAGVVRVMQSRGPKGWRGSFAVTEPRETLPLQRVLTMALLLLVVLVFAPYQFAYLVLVLVHLFTTVRFLLLAWDGTPSSRSTSAGTSPSSSSSSTAAPRSAALTAAAIRRLWDRYHYSLSVLLVLVALLPINALILVVWIRNLAVGWLAPFSSDHNVLLLVGFLANVEAVHGGRMIVRSRGKSSTASLATTFLLALPALYSLLYGIRTAHRLYPLTNLSMLFLAARTSSALFSSPASGVSGAAEGELVEPLVGGGSGKRRTSAPPEPVADLGVDGAAVVADGQGGVVRKVASVGGGGRR
ncbi:hypothetical protein JCM8097_004517 [Rhodosporidiobolus ruineniae]